MAERRRRARTDPYTDGLRILALAEPDRLSRLLACFGPALPADRLIWEPFDAESSDRIEWNPNGDQGPLDPVPVGDVGRLQLTATGPVDRDVLSALVTSIRMLTAETAPEELVALRADETRARLDLRGTRHQLTVTRDLERQRLVASLLKFAGEPLHDVGQHLDELEQNSTNEQLVRVRDALDVATERFRTVARGIYPVMLRERGPAETLRQVAATLSRPVEFVGGLGARAGWEVESGLYHAAARTLVVLSESAETGSVVHATFNRDEDRLGLVVTASIAPAATDIAAALADHASRISALGGGLSVRSEEFVTVVELWLFDGLHYRP